MTDLNATSLSPEVTVSRSLISAALEKTGLTQNNEWQQKADRLQRVVDECQLLLARPAIDDKSSLEPANFENWLNHPLMVGPARERLLALIKEIPGLAEVLNQRIDSGEALQARYRASMQIAILAWGVNDAA